MSKVKGPKWEGLQAALKAGTVEQRSYCAGNYRSVPGKSTVDIDCPFCLQTVRAYPWSLAGSGKRCECGALFGSWKCFHFTQRAWQK